MILSKEYFDELKNEKLPQTKQIEKPDPDTMRDQGNAFNILIQKNFSKLVSIARQVMAKPEYIASASALQVNTFKHAQCDYVYSDKEKSYIYAYCYDFATVDSSKFIPNTKTTLSNNPDKQYKEMIQTIIVNLNVYLNANVPGAYVEDAGAFGESKLVIFAPYTGAMVTESVTETPEEVKERLDDLDDGTLVFDNEINQGLNEAEGFYTLTQSTPPEDFKKTVLKAFKAGENMAENKQGVGEGAAAAFFGGFHKLFVKSQKNIEEKPVKKAYSLIIPKGLRINLKGMFNPPKEYEKVALEMLKAAGFKKGGSVNTGMGMATYYYKYSPDKKFIYASYYTAPGAYFVLTSQLQVYFQCTDNTEANRKAIIESATVDPSMDFDKYFSFQDDDNLSPGMFDSEDVLYRDPVFNKAIVEYFNISDDRTRKYLLSLNEAGQNSVLMSLTSKLYDKIVEKCDDIDYGEIPNTKGDITRLSKYQSMKETISIMHDLLSEYKQDTGPVDELSVALSNIETRKDLFERAFRYNSELPIAMYNNVVLGIITGISYMIATCIEFIKDPGAENFRIALDKTAYAKTKDHLIYSTLKSFNKTCSNREFDKAMEAVLKASTRNFAGSAVIGGIAFGILAVILILIPVLRELIFLFYYLRMRVSDFFDIQAELLQMNAYSIEANNTLDKEQQKKIMAKQLKYVEKFKKLSNAFAIDVKKAEVSSDKEKKSDDETKMLINDIDGIDKSSNVSALF